MKSPRSVLDSIKPSPAALAQLERLQSVIKEREANISQSDVVEFQLVTPVPRADWPPPPLVVA